MPRALTRDEQAILTLDAKCARRDAILAAWDADPDQVRALVAWPWILDALEQLPETSTA